MSLRAVLSLALALGAVGACRTRPFEETADASVVLDASSITEPDLACTIVAPNDITSRVNCAGQDCDRTQQCCVVGSVMECVSSQTPLCATGTFRCDGPEDCDTAFTVCCLKNGFASCTSACTGEHLCHGAVDCGGTKLCVPRVGLPNPGTGVCSASCNQALPDMGCKLPGLGAMPTAGVVTCGAAGCPNGMSCCVSRPGFTIPFNFCMAAPCPNPLDALQCDGPEDCPSGTVCCRSGGSTACTPSPSCSGDSRVCRESSQCTSGEYCEAQPRVGFPPNIVLGLCRACP